MKRLIVITSVLLCSASNVAFAADACAWDNGGFTPPANDSTRPAEEIVLLSVGLDQNGGLLVRSAKRANGSHDFSWQLAGMSTELAPHQALASDSATPFDMVVSKDTIIVFNLEPGAWSWESDPEKALFLKDRPDGSEYPHNPFSAAGALPGRPRMFAARFHAPDTLAGCSYAYNLGVVIKQGTKATPVIMDPKITNGGTGN